MESVRDHQDSDIPEVLKDRAAAQAFFGVVFEAINGKNSDKDASAKIAMAIDDVIQKEMVVDWHLKTDIQNKMINEIEDYLTDKTELGLSYDEIDTIMEKVLNIAKRRYAQ